MASPQQTLDLRKKIKRCTECSQRFSPDAAFCPFDGTKLLAAEWDPSGDALVGQTVDARYEILAVLGEGGMGRVYRARHVSLDRQFAMKVLRKDLARDDELAERFIQEARTTASIRHPNIVSISDFGRLPDETPYFVMELLTGHTLAEVIKAGGPIPAGRAVRLIKQIASALSAAHAAGVVHRDLKPENVFLVGGMAGGESDDLRIVDFGAAKIMGSSRMTKTGIVFGTPHYMSPEQASGQPVDHRADIYALGIIMYEMFAGRVPFEADTYMGVLTQHMFVQPIPPSQVNPAAKGLGALEEITLHALEKKPEDRYASMDELSADIGGVVKVSQGRMEIAPHVEGRASRPPKSVRYKMADELEPPTLEEMRVAIDSMMPPRRSPPWAWIGVGVAAVGVAIAAVVLLTGDRGKAETAQGGTRAPASATATAVVTASTAASALPPSPATTAAATKKTVHLASTPAAQVYQGGAALGTTPTDVSYDPKDAPRYVLKATGYADYELSLDDKSDADVKVALHKAAAGQGAAPSVAAPTTKAASAPASPGIDDIPNPWRHRQ